MHKLYKSLWLLITVIGTMVSTQLNAQVSFTDQTDVNGLFLNECGLPDTMTVRLAANSAQTNLTISATIPSQFVFINWLSQSGTTNSGTSLTVASMAASTTIDVKFLLKAKCGANSAGTSYKVNYTITNASGGVAPSATPLGNDFISGVKAPVLNISGIGGSLLTTLNNPTATLNSTYTRKYRFYNTGTGPSRLDTVHFEIIEQTGLKFQSLIIDGVSVSPTVVVGARDTVRYTLIKPIRTFSSFTGDTVLVEETYRVPACPPSGSSSSITGYWGCLGSKICQAAATNPSVQVPVSVPTIAFSTNSVKLGCYNTADTITLRLNNTGGDASSFNMQVGTTYPNSAYLRNNYMSGINLLARLDTTKMWVSNSPTGPWTRIYSSSTSGLPGFNNSDTMTNSQGAWPNGSLWRRNLSIGFIEAGTSVYVRYVTPNRCHNQVNICTDAYHYSEYAAQWKNNCGTTNYDFDFGNVGGGYDAGLSARTVVGDGTPDVYDGDTARISYTIGAYNGTSFQHDTSIVYFEITYPQGFTYVADTANRRVRSKTTSAGFFADSVVVNSTNRTVRWYTKTGPINGHQAYFNNFVLNSKFKVSCAGNPPSPASFSLQARVIGSYTNNCASACEIQIVCPTTVSVVPHCGICFRGGLSPRKVILQRTTLGLPDNNEDGLPDGSGTLDPAVVEFDKATNRDTFKIVYRGKIVTGNPAYPTSWANGGAIIKFPDGNSGNNDITSVGNATGVLRDASSGITYPITGILITQANSGSQREFTLDFSPSNSTGYPSGYVFENGDSIEVVSYYIYNSDNTPHGGERTDLIQTKFWVSPQATNAITNDTMRYRCDDLSASFKQVGAYLAWVQGANPVVVGCNSNYVTLHNYLSIGQCCDNYANSSHFKAEYRPHGVIDSIALDIEGGFLFDSAYMYFGQTGKIGNIVNYYRYSLTPRSIRGTRHVFDIKKLYQGFGGTVPISKGGYQSNLYVFVKGNCATVQGTQVNLPTLQGFTGVGPWSAIDINDNGATTTPFPGTNTRATYNGPSLDLASFGATNALAKQNTVSWDLVLTNTSTASNAVNSWVAFRSFSGLIQIDSVKPINASGVVIGGNLTQVGGIYQVGTINSAGATKYVRAFASFDNCKRDSLVAISSWNCNPPGYPTNLNSRPCPGDSTKLYLDTVPNTVQTDWFSTPANPITMCNPVIYEVDLSERQDARAYRPFFDIIVPNGGAGAQISAAQFKYPAFSGSYVNITGVNLGGGIIRYYVGDSSSTLKTNGLSPFEVGENNNRVRLKFTMTTNCNWISGNSLRVRGNAYRPCGDLLKPDVEFSIININGAPAPKIATFLQTTPGILTCGSNVTYTAMIRNFSGTPTVSTDSVSVVLASGGSYVSGSTVFQKNGWTQVAPIIKNVNGNVTLTWGANSIPAFDTTKWSFQVTSAPGNIVCSNQDSAVFQFTSSFTATCGLTSCNSKVLNTEKVEYAPIMKPNLKYTPGSGLIRILQDTTAGNISWRDTLVVKNLQFVNSGNDTATLPIITFYNDANGNNRRDVGETIVLVDTMDIVPNGSNILYNSTTGYSRNYLPSGATIKAFVKQNCNCDSTQFPVAAPAFYIPLDKFNIQLSAKYLAQNNAVKLVWSPITGLNYSKFELERRLINNKVYEKIHTTEANLFTNEYYYFDNDLERLNYAVQYRVKGINSVGEINYSNIVVVPINSAANSSSGLSVWPNPANHVLNVATNFVDGYNYQITDLTGRVISSGSNSNFAGEINVMILPSGVFILNVFDREHNKSVKFMISR